ncbi:MAG: hypothetical protein ACJ8C4_09730 [Gemmataceae bacterium]
MPRCAECGYLGLRKSQSGSLDEADERFRNEIFVRGAPSIHDSVPSCGMGVPEFREMVRSGHKDAITQALYLDRQCDKFVAWRRGYTPKDHADLQREESIRADSERRDREMRQWQEGQQQRLEMLQAKLSTDGIKAMRRSAYIQAGGTIVATIIAFALALAFRNR